MADIGMAACSVFFTQCPSFLSFQRNMEQSRARSLFQVQAIPTDNHLRQTLDSVAPEHLMALFDDLHRAFDEQGLLPAMRAVQNTRLIALDATWYFSSQSKNIHSPNCSCIQHTDGRTTHFHSAITPVIVSPGARAGGAVAAGVHRAAGWACEAGLRDRRGQALARRARRAVSHGQRHVVGR